MSQPQPYLRPYLNAARRHGDGFQSLLWASPQTQSARFDAIARLCDFSDLNLLDVGCGRADLLDFLLARGIRPAHYVGIEAVQELIDAAHRKRHDDCLIVRADFVREPARMLVGADAIVFSGSLNTLPPADFYRSLQFAFGAATHYLLFNFLCSPRLASADWLTWHQPQQVLAFAQRLSPHVNMLDDYLDGDCTIALRKITP